MKSYGKTLIYAATKNKMESNLVHCILSE